MSDNRAAMMKTVHLQQYGSPLDVLKLGDAELPLPGTGQVRIKVHACALNPADWALCMGFFPVKAPRGIGFDVSGVVDAVGDGVLDTKVGDKVFGVPDFLNHSTAGASEYAVLSVCFPVPEGLALKEAAALPMAVETAVRSLDLLGVRSGQTILVSGGGTMTGFAAVQIALMRGVRVIATSGNTFADRLRGLGADVLPYGDGLANRVRERLGKAPDFVLHTAQVSGLLPELIQLVEGDPQRVMSISDFDEGHLGIRTTGREPDMVLRYDALPTYARLAAERKFTIPISQEFKLFQWREAVEISLSGKAHGKLLLLIG
jgi:NADPH:quinone reductase-like Zn-dependent oxidoreductase